MIVMAVVAVLVALAAYLLFGPNRFENKTK